MSPIRFSKFSLLFCIATTTSALLTNPLTAKGVDVTNRAFVTKDIKTPDPVPIEGQQEALEVMQSGRLYRYNTLPGEDSVLSKCEEEIADYTGHKYCVGLNSCGSAILMMLKCTGLKPGDVVLSNAFTFGAVPSAIEHAGGKTVYVESNYNYVMAIDDLEKKLVAYPEATHVLVSHMRGKVGDMDAIKDACDRHDVILVEDCAHSLGVKYGERHSGHHGVASAISSQSYKMINSGEGGFLLTDDPVVAAQCVTYAGAYEGLHKKHITVPDSSYFKNLSVEIPNYSIRMSNLAAAVIRPQILTLDERVMKYNERYDALTKQLKERIGDHMFICDITPGVSPVHDSIQFNLKDHVTEAQIEYFLKECEEHGLPVELFGAKTNARNFVNWGFAPAEDPLPETSKMLKRACDVRMPFMWNDSDFNTMADVICESLSVALAKA